MKLIRPTLALFLVLLCALFSVPALAQSFTQVSSFTATSGTAVPSSAYPGSLQSLGWYDVHGNIWSLDANGRFIGTTGNGNAWNLNELVRPSAEAAVDGQTDVAFTFTNYATYTATFFRYSNNGVSASGYSANCNGTSATTGIVQIFKIIAGTATKISAATDASFTAAVGSTYICRGSAVQTNGTTTTVKVAVYAADGTTLLQSASVTDTTAALQNISSPPAIYQGQGAGVTGAANPISSIRTYTDIATAATTYNLSQSQTKGGAGLTTTTLDVAPVGIVSGSVTITPTDGSGGTFSPASVTLTNASSAVFTYTPSSGGAKTLSTTNTGGLADPAGLVFNAYILIAASNGMHHYSPFNWSCLGSRGCVSGGTYPRAINAGAYFTAVWTASASPTAILVFPTNSAANHVSYILNGVLTDNVATNGNVTLSPTASVVNTLTVYVRCAADCVPADMGTRWGGSNNVTYAGMYLDSASIPGTGTLPNGTAVGSDGMTSTRCAVKLIGDSINEGYEVDGTTTFNFMHSSSFALMQQLFAKGCDVGVQGFVGDGFLAAGNGGVPPLYVVGSSGFVASASRIGLIDSGVSELDSAGVTSAYGATGQAPSAILMNFGTNDALQYNTGYVLPAYISASVTGTLATLRVQAPNAKLVFVPGFPLSAGSRANASTVLGLISTGVMNYGGSDTSLKFTASPATASYLYTNGTTFAADSTVHPNALGNLVATPMLSEPLFSAMAAGVASSPRTFRPGFRYLIEPANDDWPDHDQAVGW